MKALHRKLLRDLRRMTGQLLTIGLVVASGIGILMALQGNWSALRKAQAAYYERYRFADVFAHLERAPDALRGRIEAIEGVARVHTRVTADALLPLEHESQPISARVISVSGGEAEALCALHLREGRHVQPGRSDEAILLYSFAQSRGVRPGASLPVVLNGKLREVRVVGIAMSPEFVIAIGGTDLSADPERFAVLWMDRDAVATTYDMAGAFNDVLLSLQPGASIAAVKAALDTLIEPYGAFGSVAREKQISHATVESELLQLKTMSTVIPVIFLAVAALLLNIVLSRLVSLQRAEIATLKAVGYSDREVGLHFLELVLVIGALGSLVGVGLGLWMGEAMVDLYAQYFKFPNLEYRLDLGTLLLGVGTSLAAALAGAVGSVRRVVRLPPAEAMRPEPPARYHRSVVDLLGLARVVGPAAHMVVRELQRRPLRALLSSGSIAASAALTLVGGWYLDGIEAIMLTQFHEVMREDVSVSFRLPRPERAVRELGHLPGVLHAEGMRVVPVRFRAAHHHRDGVVWGFVDDAELRSVRDKYGALAPLPPGGMVVSEVLARVLEVDAGDTLDVEVRSGDRQTRTVTVTGLVDESFGLQGYMRMDALRSWLGEGPVVTMALLRVDPERELELSERLRELPAVAAVSRRRDIFDRFEEQSGAMLITFSTIITLFAVVICVGVVYNNARVALSVRARDLASLRVLGFTRGEIASMLLGEMAVQVAVAIPLGLLLGRAMVEGMASTVDPETYRLPVIFTSRTYAFAVVVIVAASALSALLVRRKLDKLDLIGVLKTRE